MQPLILQQASWVFHMVESGQGPGLAECPRLLETLF